MSEQLKTTLKQHFTEAEDINCLMCELLGNVDGLSILEPSVGHGAFLGNLNGTPLSVAAVDVDPEAIRTTSSRYSNLNLTAHCEDFVDLFLEDSPLYRHPVLSNEYDLVIANPPYGLYFTKEYRGRLKKAFPNLYARESYGLFLAFAVSLLRKGGRYVFLIPDTFMTSANHKPLRKFIVENGAPSHIVRFPSKRFVTVKFGYGNLCVVAGTRRAAVKTDAIKWLDAFGDDDELSLCALETANQFSGNELLQNVDVGWSSPASEMHNKRGSVTLGDVAECKTGIYTGDNCRFIGYDPLRIKRRVNGHPVDWAHSVTDLPLSQTEQADGIAGERHYVPLMRGGLHEAFETPSAAIDWSKEAIAYYKTDKKARFQNSSFYFRDGIAVPMVSAKRISATLMSNSVFDQGVVGVFPKSKDQLEPLLVYLNSQAASADIKTLVNGSANNSANYLKRLPIPVFGSTLCNVAKAIIESRSGCTLPREVCDDFAELANNG